MVKDLDFAPVRKIHVLDNNPPYKHAPQSRYATPPRTIPPKLTPRSKQKLKLNNSTKKNVLTAAIIFVLMLLSATGIFIPVLQNPHIVIAAYIFIAIIFRLNSRISFTLALCFLVLVPPLRLVDQQGLADIYTTFCFYFLIIGVITATLELRAYKR